MDKPKKPNKKLQHQRELRGWSQQKLAEKIGTTVKRVSMWECGESVPGRYYQEKLCELFGKNAAELGFIEEPDSQEQESNKASFTHQEIAVTPAPGTSISTHQAQILGPNGVPLHITVHISQQVPFSTSSQPKGNDIIYEERSPSHAEEPSTTQARGSGEQPPSEDTVNCTRREAIKEILGYLGIPIIAPALDSPDAQFEKQASRALVQLSYIDEDVVRKYEKLTSHCWKLLRGDDLATAEYLLARFLEEVTALANQPSRYQKALAGFASQGYILAGLVAVLQLKFPLSEAHCKQAIVYSRLAGDRNLEAAALKHLAAKYMSARFPLKTLYTYQEALPLVDEISPLLRARIFLGLAVSYAQCKQKEEANRYLGLAYESFPDHPERDPAFSYADCGISSLYHYEGLIHLEFGQAKKAWNTFAKVEELTSKVIVPDRTMIEIVNCQAEAAVTQRNMDLACAHIEAGVEGAKRLGSEKRFNDAFSVYKQMQLLWPSEQKVKKLTALFLR